MFFQFFSCLFFDYSLYISHLHAVIHREHGYLHAVIHGEHGHVHGNDNEACDNGEDAEDGGFQFGQGVCGRLFEFGVVVSGNGVEGLFKFTGLLADGVHVDQDVGEAPGFAQAGAQGGALLKLCGDLAHGLADVVVVQDLGGDGDRAGDGQAGLQHHGHGVGVLAGGIEDGDIAQDGQAELDPGQVDPALLRIAVELEKEEDRRQDNDDDHIP